MNNLTGSRKRAAIYCRASTPNQDTGLSTATQAEHGLREAEFRGLAAGDEDIFYDLGISGMTDNREGLRRMMLKALSPERPYAAIIVTDIARVMRGLGGYINLEEILAEEGIELISLGEPPGNPQTKINTNRRMKAVMNESQVVDTALRTRNSQMFAVAMGFFIGWSRPFGYGKKKVMWRNAEHTKLEPHPEEWPHLLHMIDMAKNNHSLRQIIEYAELSGLKHPAHEVEKQKNGQPVRRGHGRFTTDSLSYLLTKSKAVLGWTARGGSGSGSKILHQSEEVICRDAHPAAMTEEERELIVRNFASRKREAKSPQAHRSPNPLSTLLTCGMCGATMQMHTSNGIMRLKCATSREYRKDNPNWCPNKAVRLDVLIERILQAVFGHILTPGVLKRQIREVAKLNTEFVKTQESRQKQVGKRLKELEKETGNLTAAIATYGPQNPIWGSEIERRQQETSLLQRELQAINDELAKKLLFLNEPERILENALNLGNDLNTEDLHELGQFLQSLIDRGTILNKVVTLYYRMPLPKEGTEQGIQSEEIWLNKKKSCHSVGNTGMNPPGWLAGRSMTSRPRRRGDEPRPLSRTVDRAGDGKYHPTKQTGWSNRGVHQNGTGSTRRRSHSTPDAQPRGTAHLSEENREPCCNRTCTSTPSGRTSDGTIPPWSRCCAGPEPAGTTLTPGWSPWASPSRRRCT